ncbi:NAD(+) synthase [Crocinitomicaceae bacterium]|nr:NAD(+) synthase [Crocinitomicaceae bacterium]
MQAKKVAQYIVSWLDDYCVSAKAQGFIIGISGGVDSGLTSVLCAMTGKKVILLSMPIRQTTAEYSRAKNHLRALTERFDNVEVYDINLTDTFSEFEKNMPFDLKEQHLAMVNSRARLRMMTLYALGQANSVLVVGTGNKVEDFGVGFYTKYGDGGVDLSPIADLTKTQVWDLAREVKVIEEIIEAQPTDGLWEDGRSDEDQIGASYSELEWAMNYNGDTDNLSDRKAEVFAIYKHLNAINQHKMIPIPVCLIPKEFS